MVYECFFLCPEMGVYVYSWVECASEYLSKNDCVSLERIQLLFNDIHVILAMNVNCLAINSHF